MNYRDLGTFNKKHNMKLVEDCDTGRRMVRKELSVYNLFVYEYLYNKRPSGIPIVYKYEEEGDRLIVFEQFVEGQILEDRIREEGPPPREEGLKILMRICDIMAPLHLENPSIVHRDIKPANIMISNDGEIYLMDFNAATEYSGEKDRDTVLIGTTGYAAPEQYGFQASDPRTDVYALGKLAQELFIGEKTSQDLYNGPYRGVVRKCLNIDPDDRYKNAKTLLQAIKREGKRGLYNKEGAPWYVPPGFRTRRIWKMILGLAGYYVIFESFIILPYGQPTLEYRENVGVFIFLLLEILLGSNYMGITDRLPIAKSNNVWIKIIGRLIYMALLFVIFVLVMGMLDAFGIVKL